ncbi:MAG: pyruvoyl-dependent arginine decarboxylase [Halobacteria archaeon]|nr:pyruvoyl-dependent arginine decarboxylase [Halobacteria archaeon]
MPTKSDAGVEAYNLVPVSSILPPNAELVDVEEGTEYLPAGSIVHCVLSRTATDTRQRIASSVGVARRRPEGDEHAQQHGYLIEKHAKDDGIENIGAEAEELALELLNDKNPGNDEPPTQNFNITVKTQGERGVWTTAVALAVFIG